MLDTRRRIRQLIDKSFKERLDTSFLKFFASLALAAVAAFIPEYANLAHEARLTLFVLLFAAGLWISEAIPAFAVSLLVIALNIVLLGFNGFDFKDPSADWEYYLKPWSNPLVFLFFAGFIMAAAASKTKLDFWLAKKVIFIFGSKPKNIVTGFLLITFVFSMFISNTATTAMMLTIIIPLLQKNASDVNFVKSILLAVVVGANLGGIGTIIGTPPNAIAVGLLEAHAPNFLMWMYYALAPAVVMAVLLYFYIIKFYPSNGKSIDLKEVENIDHYDDSTTNFTKIPTIPSWKKIITVVIFVLTISLWMTNAFHNIPTTVVSLLPVVAFTMFRILDADDIATLRWDVIILIVGGLSLGLAVSKSGLAVWFANLFHTEGASTVFLVLLFAYVVLIISNFMSHTAASNIILPLVIALAASFEGANHVSAVITVAISSSFAMLLPISTPPNALVFSTGKLEGKDLVKIGILTGLTGPLVTYAWISLVG